MSVALTLERVAKTFSDEPGRTVLALAPATVKPGVVGVGHEPEAVRFASLRLAVIFGGAECALIVACYLCAMQVGMAVWQVCAQELRRGTNYVLQVSPCEVQRITRAPSSLTVSCSRDAILPITVRIPWISPLSP